VLFVIGAPYWFAVVLAFLGTGTLVLTAAHVTRRMCVFVAESGDFRSAVAFLCVVFWSVAIIRFSLVAGTHGLLWARLLADVASTFAVGTILAWLLYRAEEARDIRRRNYQEFQDKYLHEMDRLQARRRRFARRG
jgi:hypothetical protein